MAGFLGLAAVVESCTGENNEKLLVGKWQIAFDRKECLQHMNTDERKMFEAKSTVQQEVIIKDIAIQIERDNWISFQADHTFEQVFSEGETKQIGKWEIKNGNTELSLQWLKNKEDKNPQRQTCKIIRLDAQHLILESYGREGKQNSFVPYQAKPTKKSTPTEKNTPQKAQIKS